MDWLRRIRRATPPTTEELERVVPEPVERATPGVAALFDGVRDDRSHSVLDLGTATESSLRIYSRYARRVRFADLLGAATWGGWSAALSGVPAQPDRPYDLVLAWDILDRLGPEERPRLMERLGVITAVNARLHALIDASGKESAHPLRFSLLDIDRMRYETAGSARPTRATLLPAEVERLLLPFQVVRAFTSKVGLREYVALRDGA